MTVCPRFPEQLIEEAVFSPLYILASFVKDTVLIGAWVYRLSTLESGEIHKCNILA